MAPSDAPVALASPAPDGGELFRRVWVAGDPRAAGDGLGPAYNAVSCASCHAQGGAGGSGGAHTNVRVGVAADGVVPLPRHGGPDTPADLLLELRSTPALFGAGLVDAIPEDALLAAAPSGRLPRTSDGRIGRFGWDGRFATLRDAVASACASDLGLVPGTDVDADVLDALVAWIAALPPPDVIPVPGAERGRAVFDRIGCAGCHLPRVGGVDGLYSDLAFHDLGGGAVRTPPLWGVRDSAPYLHDASAETLEAAVMAHDGEAVVASVASAALPPDEAAALGAFLRSLVAPLPRGAP